MTIGEGVDHSARPAPIALGFPARFLSHPACISFSVIGLGILALQIPQAWYGRVWSVGNVSFGLAEIALLGFIYAVLAGAWWTASSVARWRGRREAGAIIYDRASQIWLLVVTAAGAAGLAGTLFVIVARLGISGIIEAFTSNRVNELKDALYDDYSVGLTSLRYCLIIAAPAAALVVFRLRQRTPLTIAVLVVAVTCLVANSLISQRLSLIAASFVYCVLHFRSGGRVSWRAIGLGAIVVALVLAALNASRNANFYHDIGINNPLMAALAEAITYVATPAQGALAAMSGLLTGNFTPPTGISSELTTNSSLLELLGQFGYAGPLIALLVTTIWGFVYVKAYFATRPEFITGAGVIGYAFAEFWRVFLFEYGIFFVLVTFTLLVGGAVRLGLNSIRGANGRRESLPLSGRPPVR